MMIPDIRLQGAEAGDRDAKAVFEGTALSIRNFASQRNSISLPPARLRELALRLHRLGVRALYEYLAEILAGRDPAARLEVFAAIDPDVLHMLGGDRLPPHVRVVETERNDAPAP
jgi:hypothetical protein